MNKSLSSHHHESRAQFIAERARSISRIPVLLLAVLAVSGGLSCAVAPTADTGSRSVPSARTGSSANATMQTAYGYYEKRDFASAAATYDQVAQSSAKKPATQRLAYMGKALVHLSTDPEWRNLEEAGQLLQAAEALDARTGNMETAMLMDVLSALISVEANNSELNTKVSHSAAEIARLKQDREELITDQAALNEALEKLKELTIGN